MLVLTRKLGEQIRIGPDITVTLVAIQGNRIRIGIDAPQDVEVLRGELAEFRTQPPAKPEPTPDAISFAS